MNKNIKTRRTRITSKNLVRPDISNCDGASPFLAVREAGPFVFVLDFVSAREPLGLAADSEPKAARNIQRDLASHRTGSVRSRQAGNA